MKTKYNSQILRMLPNEFYKYSANLQKKRNVKRDSIIIVTLGMISTIWVLSARKFNNPIESINL